MKKYLSSDQFKLYDLIWSRALASQMKAAEFDRNTIQINSKDNSVQFISSGSVIKFDGFLKVYSLQNDDEEKNIFLKLKLGEK